MSLSRVLVANRGEIAVRVIRACRKLGIETVAAISEADRDALPAKMADRAICIGPPRSTESYLNAPALVAAALGTGCDALHPGYGFLSERAELAQLCADNQLVFVGPTADNIRAMGDKLAARRLAAAAGVPTVPGSDTAKNAAEAVLLADRIGYPILLKASAGGGGRGIKLVRNATEMQETFGAAAAEARAAFGDDTLYMERYIADARHIEVQVLGDRFGTVIHCGERDCSLQRRHQKIVEEAPAYALSRPLRAAICRAAVNLAREIQYQNAGTVEFIFDNATGEFFFLEMNTRIQVEHPVTEMVTGIDLVAEQLRIARGEPISLDQSRVRMRGHAIECRINAESPQHGFRPCPGRIAAWDPPSGPGIRVDSHCFPGYLVPPYYDSLLAKLIVHGRSRVEAVERAAGALRDFQVSGVDTGVPFLLTVIEHPEYRSGKVNTRWLENRLEDYSAGRPD